MEKAAPEQSAEERTAELMDIRETLQAEIHERRRLEDVLRRRLKELAEADRRKDEFLALLAHELRNPLAPIQNSLQVMRQVGTGGPVAERARDMVERHVRHLTHLLDDLLNVSRVTRGEVTLQKEPVDLSVVVHRAVETVRALTTQHGQELTVNLPPESIRLEADPVRLEQVLINLLNNAVKFTDPGGQVRLSAERDGTDVVIRVQDTGVGIAPELLPQIFDLFMQGDKSLERARGGLGVGLTLVKRLVEMHSGTVTAHSDGVAKGCEFVVRLPIHAPRPTEGDRITPAVHKGGTPLLRVLVVDDNRDAATSLAAVLRLWGHEVSVAYDGPEALELAKAEKPDVVLLDIGLPGMDGYEVAQHLRNGLGLGNAKIIALTGYGQEAARRRSEQAGFDHHVTKPVVPEELRQLLNDCRPRASA